MRNKCSCSRITGLRQGNEHFGLSTAMGSAYFGTAQSSIASASVISSLSSAVAAHALAFILRSISYISGYLAGDCKVCA